MRFWLNFLRDPVKPIIVIVILCRMQEGLGEKRRGEFHRGARGIKSGDLLGDDRFIEDVLGCLGGDLPRTVNVAEVVDAVCDFFQITKNALAASGKGRLASEARAVAALIVREIPDVNLMELSRYVSWDVPSLFLPLRDF